MREAQAAKETLAGARDLQRRFTTVFRGSAPLDQSLLDAALHQLDSAVVLDQQALRDDPDGGFLLRTQGLENEQELVLLWLHLDSASGGLAEGEEATDW